MLPKGLRDALGYDRKKLGQYRDFALSITGGLCLLFGLISATEAYSSRASVIDWKIAIGCFAGTILCVIVSPNRASVLAGSFASVAGLAFLKFMSSGDLKALGLGAAMVAVAGIVAVFAGVFDYFKDR
jgi:hypothetical protein